MLEGGCETYSSIDKYRFLALAVPVGFSPVLHQGGTVSCAAEMRRLLHSF